jgi:tripartite-type tricarboxylate transporter receptor subunit TctC
MTQERSWWRALAVFAAVMIAATGQTQAQGIYPSKPIRVILPFTLGGTGDGVMRVLGQEISQHLGQPMVMENIVGGTGIVGQDVAMRAAPDGYTIVAVSLSGGLAYHGLNRTIDYTKDFTPIAQVYSQYSLLVTNHNLPEMANIRTLRDLIAYAKANPGKLNYASQGTGSAGHLVMERIKALTGINIVHVPYRGAAPAYNDLLAGQIQMMSVSLGAMPYIKAGKMRAIGIGSAQRSPLLPDVPTYAEEGLTGFVSGVWFGIAAPANTPKDIVNRLSAEVKAAIAKPDVAEKLRRLGTDPEYLPGPAFGAVATKDFEQWGKVMRDNNIKLD